MGRLSLAGAGAATIPRPAPADSADRWPRRRRGIFPARNTAADGYRGTAPFDAFAPDGYGLHSTSGNVWEWCADRWTTERGRPAETRTANAPDSSTGHTGFRRARDAGRAEGPVVTRRPDR